MTNPQADSTLPPETAAFLDDLYRSLQFCSSVQEVQVLLNDRLPVFLQRPLPAIPAVRPAEPYGRSLIGGELGLRSVMQLVSAVASSDTTVLLTGETGTGKELIARAIHDQSPRRNQTMVRLNCAALPEDLIESELFGHEAGSFTGALATRAGSFELAHGGTLFLDEVGELSLSAQAKLLRVIQEKEVERIGGRHSIRTDVRLLCATSLRLADAVKQGAFRTDLYYRLHVFPIEIPPLRERLEDIVPLANHFLEIFCRKTGNTIKRISAAAIRQLLAHDWPGNVRELEHVIERAVLLTTGPILREVMLPRRGAVLSAEAKGGLATLAEQERGHIIRALRACGGKIRGADGAAQLLGVPPTTLHSKMKKAGIRKNAE